jgi:hypothetical protein
MLFHPYISVPRNDYLDEDIPDDEGIPDVIDEGKPDFLDEDTPACPIPSQPSRCQSSSPRPGPANHSYAPPQNSMPGWDMAKTMCLAGGAGLEQVIAAAEEATPRGGLPVASERAGDESRRTGLKRKEGEITRSAAEDFALFCALIVSTAAIYKIQNPKKNAWVLK